MKNEDDLKALYEDANRLEAAQPGARVREAAIAHAKAVQSATLLALPTDIPKVGQVRGTQTVASNSGNWRMAIAASIVMVPMLGLLVFHLQKPQGSEAAIQVASNSVSGESTDGKQTDTLSPEPMAAPLVHDQTKSKSKAKAQSTVPAAKRTDASSIADQVNRSAAAAMASRSNKSDDTSSNARTEAVIIAKQEISDAKVAEESARAQTMGAVSSQHTVVAQAAVPASQAMLSAPIENAQKAKSRNSLADSANEPGVTLVDQLAKASREANVTQVLALVKRGVPVNALDSTGKSALMHAVEARQAKTVETLVQLGADPHVKGKDGVSAMDVAKRIGDQRILSMLE
jgi:hypothetical protein